MSKKRLILSLILSLIFCLSAFSVSVSAINDYVDDNNYSSDIIPDNGNDSSVVPDDDDDINGDDTDNDNQSSAGSSNTDQDYTPDDNYGDGSSDSGTDYNTDYNNNNSGDYSNNSGYNENYTPNNDDSSSYVGGGQTYVVPENTAPSVSLYNSEGKINEKTLNNGDWNDIAQRLKNADTSSGGDDFAFIQNADSNFDNGHWMLIVGIICIAFSAAGIIYFIVLTVRGKKPITATSAAGGRRGYYGDGYSFDSERTAKRKSKFDTAEVTLPKRAKTTRGKSGGKYSK